MPSPYQEELEQTVEEIYSAFIDEFGITTPYVKTNLKLGSTYGIVAPVEYIKGEERRTAFQKKELKLAVTLSAVYENRLEANKKTTALMAALDHGISAMKKAITPWSVPGTGPYDLMIYGNIGCTGETTPSAPYYWQMYLAAELVMPFNIYIDIEGKHSIPEDS